MSKAILVKGGIGKVLCTLPAIRRSKSMAISGGWTEFYSAANISAIELDSAFLAEATRDKDIIDADFYLLAKVRSGEWSFIQGANYMINGEPIDELPVCDIPLSILNNMRAELGDFKGEQPLVVVNPVGSNDDGRSMVKGQLDAVIEVIKAVGAKPLVLCDKELDVDADRVTAGNTLEFASIVACADYFIGIDSAAMHIARAHSVPGSVFFGATAGVKFYPDWFNEHRNPTVKEYSLYIQHLHLNSHVDLLDNALHDSAMHYPVDADLLKEELLEGLGDKLSQESGEAPTE